MMNLLIILGLAVAIPVVCWLLFGHKIGNKQAVLSLLEPIYKVAFYVILFCAAVNLTAAAIIDEFFPTIELSGTVELLRVIFFTYFTFLAIFRVSVLCLKVSLTQSENNGKISFLERLRLFWEKPKFFWKKSKK